MFIHLHKYKTHNFMQSKENIIEIGKKMPHGAKKRIAKNSGLHYNTVAGYFRGEKVSYYAESIILKEAMEFFDLMKEAEATRERFLNYGI